MTADVYHVVDALRGTGSEFVQRAGRQVYVYRLQFSLPPTCGIKCVELRDTQRFCLVVSEVCSGSEFGAQHTSYTASSSGPSFWGPKRRTRRSVSVLTRQSFNEDDGPSLTAIGPLEQLVERLVSQMR